MREFATPWAYLLSKRGGRPSVEREERGWDWGLEESGKGLEHMLW